MTQVFEEGGIATGVTVVEAGPCIVTQVKSAGKDGYNAIQLGFGETDDKKLSQSERGHLRKKKLPLVKHLREIPAEADEHKVGDRVDVSIFNPGDIVDVIGTSKGKGFAGVMKRHGFHGVGASHGAHKNHRKPGSIGACATPGRVFKGVRMSGRMGSDTVTTQNVTIHAVDAEKGLILLKGAVPGPKGGLVVIRSAAKSSVKEA